MRGDIRFKSGVSQAYKDLVLSLLMYEPTRRIPLIMVFNHQWIKGFQERYDIRKDPKNTPKPPSKKQ